ncbi:carbon monoxide dehydrogenase subunit G [Azospirillum sp. RWY-5-1]|uniref:Carbon monoxide dehydrogenase subunit G n=1 Tax=Azospirillum oleiclasticum TaxID=2735135 RepID=A0ABX2T4U1_9PROT|nr:carbon monoxide dehydrogenase subunit G [Azospirillum oleiclasticum]NYZ10976.1 carbon monoxide dehydrogenase subunit G [Azospirillum oleiclasticum]NYZ18138.1 carbon monoxide dehydrogenase subunit G [Azospirillum oleiclasticum]
MDMSGQYRIEAPRERVWAALNDPEVLRQCIPGCEEVQKLSDTEFTAKVAAKVGPVSAKFSGKVTLSDLDPPHGYTITGEGSGGAAGFGKGGANVRLEPEGDSVTLLSYTAHAQVGGKLAQIGSRLIDGTARKMAEDFFAKFARTVGTPAPVEAPAPVTAAAAEETAAPTSASVSTPPVTPTRTTPPPEIPLPLPGRHGGSGFYLPWAALLLAVVLFAALSWAH